jgi:hypothetical protein
MARQQKSQIILDWITVSYRTVWLLGGGLALLVAALLTYWVYFAGARPRTEAADAIARAEERLQEARTLDSDERIDELRANAKAALQEARAGLDEGRFDDARRAAIRSENLSQKALDIARGEEAGAQKVRFYRLEGDVRVKRAGEFSWDAADSSMTLRVGDQVKTATSASAQIIYFDGTVTTIQPGSLLEIRELSEDPATRVKKVTEKLNWGTVVASAQKKNTDGSVHEVATEKASARVTEPSELKVVVDKERQTASFDVFSGRAEIATGSRRESLEAGERVRAGADGTLAAKESLPAAPRLVAPTDQRVFVYDNPADETTTFSWEKVPEASRYHLLISDRQLFTDPLLDDAQRRENSVLISSIEPADYYWKVAAINTSGTEGPWSPTRRFRVTSQRIRDRGDTTPPLLEVTEFVQTGAMVILNGRTEPGALLWVENEKIEVYENGTFYAVVRLRKEGENTITLLAQDAAGNTATLRKKAIVESF